MDAHPGEPKKFSEILQEELKQISDRRRAVNSVAGAGAPPPAPPPPAARTEEEVREEALEKAMVGLSFSGGGIRSATFNLGVLQALADFGLLKYFDYLSTVSGGGYIGSWLAAWIKRDGSLANVEKQLKLTRVDQAQADPGVPRDETAGLPAKLLGEAEPEPIAHLRAYSNYLSPRLGIFSADVWVLGAIYLRNLLLNQAALLPAFLFAMMFVRLVYWIFADKALGESCAPCAMFGALVLVAPALVWIIYSLWRLRIIHEKHGGKKVFLQLGTGKLHLFVLLPLLIGSGLVCWIMVSRGIGFWSAFGDMLGGSKDVVNTTTDSRFLSHSYWGTLVAAASGLAICVFLARTLPTAWLTRTWRWTLAAFAGLALTNVYLWCVVFPGAELWWTRSVACGVVVGAIFGAATWLLQLGLLAYWFCYGTARSGNQVGLSILGATLWVIASAWIGMAGAFHASLPVFLVGYWRGGISFNPNLLLFLWCGVFVAALHAVGYLFCLLMAARKPSAEVEKSHELAGTAVPPAIFEPSNLRRLGEVYVAWNGLQLVGSTLLGLLTGVGAVVVFVAVMILMGLLPLEELHQDFLYWHRAIVWAASLGLLFGFSHLYFVLFLLLRLWRDSWKESKAESANSGQLFWPDFWKRLQLDGARSGAVLATVFGLLAGTALWYFLKEELNDFLDVDPITNVVFIFGIPTALALGVFLLWHCYGLREMLLWVLSGILAGALGGFLLYVVAERLNLDADTALYKPALVAVFVTFGPPAVLTIIGLMAALEIGLLSRFLPETVREWLGSLAGWLLIYSAWYLIVVGVVLFGGWLLIQMGPMVRAVLGVGWMTAALGGVFAGHSPRTGGAGPSRLDLVAKIAPYIFLAGLAFVLSGLVSLLVDNKPNWENARAEARVTKTPDDTPPTKVTKVTKKSTKGTEAEIQSKEHTETLEHEEERTDAAIRDYQYWKGLEQASTAKLLGWFAAFGVLTFIMAWRVDVNIFSLSAMYGNRLTRCYLGASRAKPQTPDLPTLGAPIKTSAAEPLRQPNPITGIDPNDDIPLCDLAIEPKGYQGPYVLINAALNHVRADNLAWQERMAESFVFTPRYCGSLSTGFQPVFAKGADAPPGVQEIHDKLTLGRAVTISGAAASPNMGYHSSPAVTALMTVFNARLGRWVRNPAPVGLGCWVLEHLPHWQWLNDYRRWHWSPKGPRTGLLYLGAEMFGFTGARSGYVYLSDGGHFENLGAYELVRRRCRFIVATDAGADPGYAFEDLAGLIRKCRTDFGIRIEIDVTPVRPDGPHHHSRWHCAIGLIRYDDVDRAAAPGILLYIKASLSGDEPSDVQNYAAAHATFPHESTMDQFFSESQFESYRALGHHIAQKVLSDAVRQMHVKHDQSPTQPGTQPADAGRYVKSLFSALRRRWFPPPPDQEKQFLESVKPFVDAQKALRTDNDLRQLSGKLYPDFAQAHLPQPPNPAGPGAFPDLHMVAQMLRVMENAWLGSRLEGYYAHPLNRGWMSVFRRWASSEAFRQYWPFLRGEFSQDFVSFCAQQLALKTELAQAVRVDPRTEQEVVRQLFDDLAQEWKGVRKVRKIVDPDSRATAPRSFIWRTKLFAAIAAAARAETRKAPRLKQVLGMAIAQIGKEIDQTIPTITGTELARALQRVMDKLDSAWQASLQGLTEWHAKLVRMRNIDALDMTEVHIVVAHLRRAFLPCWPNHLGVLAAICTDHLSFPDVISTNAGGVRNAVREARAKLDDVWRNGLSLLDEARRTAARRGDNKIPLHQWADCRTLLRRFVAEFSQGWLDLATLLGPLMPGLQRLLNGDELPVPADVVSDALISLKTRLMSTLPAGLAKTLPLRFIRKIEHTLGLDPLVWLIPLPTHESVRKDWGAEQYACGFIWVLGRTSARAEIVVWLRGPYRNLGIGRECFDFPLDHIWNTLQAAAKQDCLGYEGDRKGDIDDLSLIVRYPNGALPGSSDKLERAMWLSFFFDYDFRRLKVPADTARSEPACDLILERRYADWIKRQA